MKRFLIACVGCLALLTTSCGISRQATGNSNVTQTKVVLAKKNYKVVGMVSGESSQNYWFGIGGLSKKSLGESAMSDMYKNANLTGSQAIINVNVCYKNTFALIYSGAKAIATGTVIQFVDNMDEPVTSDSLNTPMLTTRSNDITPSVIGGNNAQTSIQSNPQKESFTLIYLKKRSSQNKWDVVKEEHRKATLDEVKVLAEKWENKSSEKYDYKCQIKKSK